MANWKYKLKSGSALRTAIDDEDYTGVLDALEDCFKEIHQAMPKYFDSDDLNDILNDDIANVRDNLENYEDYGMDFDDAVDDIDYLLAKLYDICDDLRIWVEL